MNENILNKCLTCCIPDSRSDDVIFAKENIEVGNGLLPAYFS